MKDSFLCLDKVRKISVASNMWFFLTNLLTLKANKGRFNKNENQYPLTKNKSVMKPCNAASGTNHGFNLLHNSMGLM